MFIKICGVTQLEDAVFAHEQGAEIIGVVLAPQSPRRGTQEVIGKISREGIRTAAVYVDMGAALNEESNEEFAQLHFDSTPDQVDQIRQTGRKVISVMDVSHGISHERMNDASRISDLLLLENRKGISGTLDREKLKLEKNMGLAGGIGVHNIRDVLKMKPGFVDLSSSLESSPGRKDMDKIRHFFQEVNNL